MTDRPKYWYERNAELNSAADRREFLRGYFGITPASRESLYAGIVSGVLLGQAIKGLKKKK